MAQPFFPNLPFAVTFAAPLAAGLVYAAWTDWKTLVVSKWVSVGLLAGGLILNVVRGAWLSAVGGRVWLFDPGPALLGGVDGFAFALVGFLAGFGLFFLLWIFGVCGGGDVKLVGAVGAWLGPGYVFYAILLSIPFLVLLVLITLSCRVLGGKLPSQSSAAPPRHPTPRRQVTSYALSFALGAGVVLVFLAAGFV